MGPLAAAVMSAALRVTAFAAQGALGVVQDLVRAVLPHLTDQANPALVAEETLALVAVATARAAEVGLRADADAALAVGPVLAELPFLYHDYLLGSHLLAAGAEGPVTPDQSVYDRLARKVAFYTTHLPPGRAPGPAVLHDKMALWMGRISPPKLPTTPTTRLADLGLVDPLATHCRLVLAFAQQAIPS